MFLALLVSLSWASACEPADLDCDGRVTSAEKAAYEHGCRKPDDSGDPKADDSGRTLRPLVDRAPKDDSDSGKTKDVRRRPREDRRGHERGRGRGHGAGAQDGKDVKEPAGGR